MVLPMTPQADFQAAVLDKLRRAPLEPAAQKALLEVLIAAARPAKAGRPSVVDPLAKWLGEPAANAVQLEFEALRRSFALRLRLQLLACTNGTAEVNELHAAGSRQTVHDRLKAGTLLGILDQGKWRFPLWQFDADPGGPWSGLIHPLAPGHHHAARVQSVCTYRSVGHGSRLRFRSAAEPACFPQARSGW